MFLCCPLEAAGLLVLLGTGGSGLHKCRHATYRAGAQTASGAAQTRGDVLHLATTSAAAAAATFLVHH